MRANVTMRIPGIFAIVGMISCLAGGAEVRLTRVEIPTPPETAVKIEFRGVSATEVEKLEGSVDGKPVAAAEFSPWSAAGRRVSVLFLLDVSDASRSTEVEAGRQLIQEAIRSLPAKGYDVAVATVGQNLKLVFDFGSDARVQEESLGKAKAGEYTAEIFRCSKEALDRLAGAAAGRSALVLLSDGKSEDKDPQFQPDPIIEQAKRQGTPVFCVGYAESQKATVEWQSMRRIATSTGGVFLETEPNSTAPNAKLLTSGANLSATLSRVMESGGTATFPLGDAGEGSHQVGLKISFKDGREPLLAEKSVIVPPRPGVAAPARVEVPVAAAAAGETPPPAPAGGETPVAAATSAAAPQEALPNTVTPAPEVSWLDQNRGLATGLGAALVALIVVLVFLLMRLLKTEAPLPPPVAPPLPTPPVLPNPFLDPPTPEPVVQAPPAIAYGWLEELDGSQSRHPLAKSAVRIGRSAESEVRFINDSVSSHHAEIVRHRDKSLVVTDLKSSNGVLVNGKRIEQCVLVEGDTLEIGEIKLRLVLNSAES